jgi:uncharacterized protein (TIGR04255 family)
VNEKAGSVEIPSSLPKYNKPPVVEVAIGVNFEMLAGFKTPHFGVFWSGIKSDYPIFDDLPPLTESPTEIVEIPPLRRVWLSSADSSYVMQIQPDRFIHNWRKQRDSEQYPSFQRAKARFYTAWRSFHEFVRSNAIGEIRLSRFEVTYVNHILGVSDPISSAFETHLPIMKWAASRPDPFLPEPKTMGFNLQFSLPDKVGTLQVWARHGVRAVDQQQVLQVDLTTRGSLKPDGADLDARLELAHEWIVRGFTDITSSGAHRIWERTQ